MYYLPTYYLNIGKLMDDSLDTHWFISILLFPEVFTPHLSIFLHFHQLCIIIFPGTIMTISILSMWLMGRILINLNIYTDFYFIYSYYILNTLTLGNTEKWHIKMNGLWVLFRLYLVKINIKNVSWTHCYIIRINGIYLITCNFNNWLPTSNLHR